MNNCKNFAEEELKILVKSHTDPEKRPLIEEFIPEILALCEKFGNSGQSGGSAPYTANALANTIKKLCLFKPINPIMGTEDEWTNTFNDTFQNKRCSSIFQDGINGQPYYLDAIIWQGEEKYDTFTGTVEGIRSRQYIKSFPFEPKTFYIDVVRHYDTLEEINRLGYNYIETDYKTPDGKIVTEYYYTTIKDKNQLEEVKKYYLLI